MAEKGLPPKSPVMPIGGVAHNHKRYCSSMWTGLEESMLAPELMVSHLRTTSESHPTARKADEDSLEGGLAHLNKGKLKIAEYLTGPPRSSDPNSSSSEGGVATGSSSKNGLVDDHKSPCEINGRSDPNMDPKRAKRIIANRLSAQRSRLKKMKYITELERRVNELEAEIGLLSPQVAYYANQRRRLAAENNIIKQRIAALMHEQVFKDAQFDALQADGERLGHLQEQEQQHMMTGFQFDNLIEMNMRTIDPLNFIYD